MVEKVKLFKYCADKTDMEAKAIIEQIDAIYERFKVPEYITQHMKRVAAVARMIVEHYQGELDGENIIASCLLHDLGNMVKVKFDNPLLPIDDLEGDKKIQQWVKETYGENEHEATKNMVKELGVSERIIFLLEHSGVQYLDEIKAGDDAAKIFSYADWRVAPTGVTSLRERLAEATKRYGFTDDISEECARIEEEIFTKLDIAPEDINEKTIDFS
tara:strand:+ start:542 stop:1189 length:648 start_codon:yes stop_codon:yes gene_type:complete